jgi:CTP-dependent riboflavin kinase
MRFMATEIQGIVRSGRGEARGFTQLDWVRDQFRDKLGFDPFPGTLNLETTDRAAIDALRSVRSVMIDPAPNFCAARCYRVRINGQMSAIWIVPEIEGYPTGQLELIAPVSLREALSLKDGTIVTVTIEGDV